MIEDEEGVRIVGDEIIITDPEIISKAEDLARWWGCTAEHTVIRCIHEAWEDYQGSMPPAE